MEKIYNREMGNVSSGTGASKAEDVAWIKDPEEFLHVSPSEIWYCVSEIRLSGPYWQSGISVRLLEASDERDSAKEGPNFGAQRIGFFTT